MVVGCRGVNERISVLVLRACYGGVLAKEGQKSCVAVGGEDERIPHDYSDLIAVATGIFVGVREHDILNWWLRINAM